MSHQVQYDRCHQVGVASSFIATVFLLIGLHHEHVDLVTSVNHIPMSYPFSNNTICPINSMYTTLSAKSVPDEQVYTSFRVPISEMLNNETVCYPAGVEYPDVTLDTGVVTMGPSGSGNHTLDQALLSSTPDMSNWGALPFFVVSVVASSTSILSSICCIHHTRMANLEN